MIVRSSPLMLCSLVALVSLAGCADPAGMGSRPRDFVLPKEGDGLGVLRQELTMGDGPNGAHIIFLNFDGAMLKPVAMGVRDDSAKNETDTLNFALSYPTFDGAPYGPAFTRDAAISTIISMVKSIYAPFNVEI